MLELRLMPFELSDVKGYVFMIFFVLPIKHFCNCKYHDPPFTYCLKRSDYNFKHQRPKVINVDQCDQAITSVSLIDRDDDIAIQRCGVLSTIVDNYRNRGLINYTVNVLIQLLNHQSHCNCSTWSNTWKMEYRRPGLGLWALCDTGNHGCVNVLPHPAWVGSECRRFARAPVDANAWLGSPAPWQQCHRPHTADTVRSGSLWPPRLPAPLRSTCSHPVCRCGCVRKNNVCFT